MSQLTTDRIERVIELAERAGNAILDIYNAPTGVTYQKKVDSSFLTQADLSSNAILTTGLAQIAPDWPVLSEELFHTHDSAVRRSWSTLWMIDPLDGTREFVHRTDEFVINIALIHNGDAHWGLVHAPVLGTTWHGGRDFGSFVRKSGGTDRPIQCAIPASKPLRTLISRSHSGGPEHRILDTIDAGEFGPAQGVKAGSALKYCKIAQGEADFMPRLHPCMEWDTAAPQAILEGAGGYVLTAGGEPLTYNRRDTLLNGNLIALADPNLPWRKWLGLENAD